MKSRYVPVKIKQMWKGIGRWWKHIGIKTIKTEHTNQIIWYNIIKQNRIHLKRTLH